MQAKHGGPNKGSMLLNRTRLSAQASEQRPPGLSWAITRDSRCIPMRGPHTPPTRHGCFKRTSICVNASAVFILQPSDASVRSLALEPAEIGVSRQTCQSTLRFVVLNEHIETRERRNPHEGKCENGIHHVFLAD